MRNVTKGLLYHLPTKKIAQRFLEQCDRENIRWNSGKVATEKEIEVFEDYAIFVNLRNELQQTNRTFYRSLPLFNEFPIVEWEETPLEEFEVGEEVVVSGGGINDIHSFKIGESVTITAIDRSTTEFPIEARDKSGRIGWMKLSSISKIEGEKSVDSKFKKGDVVVVIGGMGLHGFNLGDIITVVEVDGSNVPYGCVRRDGGLVQWFTKSQIKLVEEREEMKSELRFEIGDIIVVTNEINGHEFKIGEAVKVVDIHHGGFYDDNGAAHYMAEALDGRAKWCLAESEVEEFEEDSEPTSNLKHKVGDRVVITTNIHGHDFEIGEVVEILNIHEADDGEHYLAGSVETGETWCVTDSELVSEDDYFEDTFEEFEDDYEDEDEDICDGCPSYDDCDIRDRKESEKSLFIEKDESLKVGDRVKFIGRNSDEGLLNYNVDNGDEIGKIGTFGTITDIYGDRAVSVLADEYPDSLCFSRKVIEKVESKEESEPEVESKKFGLGDIISGTAHSFYSITDQRMSEGEVIGLVLDGKVVAGTLGEAFGAAIDDDIIVRVIKHDSPWHETRDFPVSSKYFNLVRKAKMDSAKPIIIMIGDVKVVFNGDYTVVTDGKNSGVAKRHPDEEYNAIEGLKYAAERFNSKVEVATPKTEIEVGDKVVVIGSNETAKTVYDRHGFYTGQTVKVVEINLDGTLFLIADNGLRQTLSRKDVRVQG